MVGKGLPVKENNEWTTPKYIFDYYNESLNFQYDLAASDINYLCLNYFSKENDALNANWSTLDGNMWCNPPYGRGLSKWIEKADYECNRGHEMLFLIPASVGTKYWSDHIWNSKSVGRIDFICGRIKFGNAKNTPTFDSAVVWFGGEYYTATYEKQIFSFSIDKFK